MQGRQVLSLHFSHSKMNQWGPEWHRLQFQSMRVLSDLIILKLCLQLPGTAIVVVCAVQGLVKDMQIPRIDLRCGVIVRGRGRVQGCDVGFWRADGSIVR